MQSVAKTAIVRALREKSDIQWKSFATGLILSRSALIVAIEQNTELGQEFVALAERFDMDLDAVFANSMSNTLGKRYMCDECGAQLLVTKAGEGRVSCCDQITTVQMPKPLPSAD